MILSSTFAEADQRARIVEVQGERYRLRGYIGAAPVRGIYVEGNEANDNRLPQGFLVDQPPGSITHPHFHETDQFQVFVEGSGRMGKKPVDPVTVQFAAGHTPYGPIVAGEAGIRYFTLRRRWDPGAKYMPRMREKLVRGHQRQRLSPVLGRALIEGVVNLSEPRLTVLFGPEPDGLAAWLVRIGPGQSFAGPATEESAGCYHVVLGGALTENGSELGRLTCQFTSADEAPLSMTATRAGACVVVLQFPESGDRPS